MSKARFCLLPFVSEFRFDPRRWNAHCSRWYSDLLVRIIDLNPSLCSMQHVPTCTDALNSLSRNDLWNLLSREFRFHAPDFLLTRGNWRNTKANDSIEITIYSITIEQENCQIEIKYCTNDLTIVNIHSCKQADLTRPIYKLFTLPIY